MSLAARLVLGLVLLALAAAGGWRAGVKTTKADWLAADARREAAATEALNEDRRRAGRAATSYEITRAAAAAQQPEARRAIEKAMQAPAPCAPGPSGPMGGILLPAAVFDGLRRAAGAAAAGPTTSEPGPALR